MLCDISLKSSLTPPKINILKHITCVIIPNDPSFIFPYDSSAAPLWAETISKRPSEAVKLDNCLQPLTCLSILFREGPRCCAAVPRLWWEAANQCSRWQPGCQMSLPHSGGGAARGQRVSVAPDGGMLIFYCHSASRSLKARKVTF